jgi:uncharacterized protein YeaO (DUF488 family)
MKRVRTKRVYDPVGKTDGMRVLVDRVWPRGMAKEALQADLWLKRIAPSTALRNWFAHDPGKWPEFKRRYFLELDANPDAVAELRSAAGKRPVTLLYSARDETHNNAVALAEYLATR